jgi:hypothetical protein
MSYDFPRYPQMYSASNTFTSDETYIIAGPKGIKGRLIDFGVFGVTTAFAGGTTTPIMSIGTVADPDAYGDDFDFGTLADNSGKSILSTYSDPADIATYILNDGAIPDSHSTYVNMKCIAATGGGAAGVARAFALIYWGA